MLTSPLIPSAPSTPPGSFPGPTVHVTGKLPPRVVLRAVHVIDPKGQGIDRLLGLDDQRLGARLITPTQLALRLEGARFVYFYAGGSPGVAPVELAMRVTPGAETEVSTGAARLRFSGLERLDLGEPDAEGRTSVARRFVRAHGFEVQAAAAESKRGRRRAG